MQRQKVIGFSGTRRGVPDRIIKEIFEYLSQKYKTFEVVSSSKGTKLAVKKAREIGVPVEVFYVD